MRRYLRILIIPVFVSCGYIGGEQEDALTDELGSDYTEQYRPQLHYSPPTGWTDKPVGLVYINQNYHLFYKHNPNTTIAEHYQLGHAVSGDLVYWNLLSMSQISEMPTEIVTATVTVDSYKTLDLSEEVESPLIMIYSMELSVNDSTVNPSDFQLAYSPDQGMNWMNYSDNLKFDMLEQVNINDLKLVYSNENDKWILLLASLNKITFYGSKNLIEWERLSDFMIRQNDHKGMLESPDLYRVKYKESDDGEWVLQVTDQVDGRGTATQYFVGEFDGTTFSKKNKSSVNFWQDHGMDNGFVTICSGLPQADGRTISLAWMNNRLYANELPTSVWNGAYSLPRKLELFRNNTGIRISSYPVQEFIMLRRRSMVQNKLLVSATTDLSRYLEPSEPYLDMELVITKIQTSNSWNIQLLNSVSDTVEFGYDYERNRYYLDRSYKSNVIPVDDFARKNEVRLTKRKSQNFVRFILDKSSIEVFFDLGEVVFTAQVFPGRPFDQIKFNTKKDALVIEGVAYQASSIWEELINQ